MKLNCPNCGSETAELYNCASCGTAICLNCVRTVTGEGECGECAGMTYDLKYLRRGDEDEC